MIYTLDDRKIEIRGENYFIAESASVIGSVALEENANVWFNVVIRGDNDLITIGENSNVQDGAVLHTDPGIPLNIGKNVTVGHKAMLHGCVIGDNTLVGINSVVLNNVTIGKNCIIGANALVPEGKVIPDNSVVMGAPGKIVKETSDMWITQIKFMAESYVQNAKRFKNGLKIDERF